MYYGIVISYNTSFLLADSNYLMSSSKDSNPNVVQSLILPYPQEAYSLVGLKTNAISNQNEDNTLLEGH